MEVNLDPQFLQMIVAVFLPLAVGAVTKYLSPSWAKAGLLALLATATAFVTEAITLMGSLNIETLVQQSIITFVVAAATYTGLLKPSGIAGAVQRKSANLGVGPGDTLKNFVPVDPSTYVEPDHDHG